MEGFTELESLYRSLLGLHLSIGSRGTGSSSQNRDRPDLVPLVNHEANKAWVKTNYEGAAIFRKVFAPFSLPWARDTV